MRPYSEDCDFAEFQVESSVDETTDAGEDNSTTYEMAVDGTFQGEVGFAGDRDWVAIELVADVTYDMHVYGSTSGQGSLGDTIMAVYDADGIYLSGNDDGGAGNESYLSFTAETSGTYYVMARGFSSATGTYQIAVDQVSSGSVAEPEIADLDTLAEYLTDGYWQDGGQSPHSFNLSASNVITVDLTALPANAQQLARWALEAWEAVADITFQEVSNGAMITFDDSGSGASASYSTRSGYTTSADILISADWVDDYGDQMGAYAFQTYLHEIGHALGLGHMGDYNGGAVFGEDNTFANDSWQVSVMSYFSQTENTEIDASYANVVTAMAADIAAIQTLYGAAGDGSLTAGDTVFGLGHTLGDSWLGQLYDAVTGVGYADVYDGSNIAATLFDAGGYDIVDYSWDGNDQQVDLTGGAISDVLGATGNLIIAEGTQIEEYHAGSGDDDVTGNSADNALYGYLGQDTLAGGDGKDKLFGGGGADSLSGGAGNDRLVGGDGSDALDGGAGVDQADYKSSDIGVIVDLENDSANAGGAAGDVLSDIEDLRGSGDADQLSGDSAANELKGRGGKDQLEGRGGDDTLLGGGAVDILSGGEGADLLKGNNKADQLFGDGGADVLKGGAGKDELSGGAGDDILNGGRGSDTFRFDGGNDVIEDFSDDLLVIDVDLGGGTSAGDVMARAQVSGDDIVIDFGGGDALTLQDFTDLNALETALSVI